MLQTLHIAQGLNAHRLTWTSTLSSVWTCTVTVNMRSPQTQDLGRISPLSRPLSSSFLPLPLCKAQGIQSSKATPLCTSAVLDSQAGRRGEGPIRGPVGQGTWLWKDLGGCRLDRGGVGCLRAVRGLPWRYCLTVFTTSNSVSDLSSPSLYSSTGPLCPSSSNVNVGGLAGWWVSVCVWMRVGSLFWWFSAFLLCSCWSSVLRCQPFIL